MVFGGEVKEVSRKDLAGPHRSLHIIPRVMGSQWEFLRRGETLICVFKRSLWMP